MAEQREFVLKQWPGIKRDAKPSDLQNFSLYYRKDIPITLSSPPWEKEDEAQHDE